MLMVGAEGEALALAIVCLPVKSECNNRPSLLVCYTVTGL